MWSNQPTTSLPCLPKKKHHQDFFCSRVASGLVSFVAVAVLFCFFFLGSWWLFMAKSGSWWLLWLFQAAEVSQNHLEQLPPSLKGLRELQELKAEKNQLRGVEGLLDAGAERGVEFFGMWSFFFF